METYDCWEWPFIDKLLMHQAIDILFLLDCDQYVSTLFIKEASIIKKRWKYRNLLWQLNGPLIVIIVHGRFVFFIHEFDLIG